MQICKKFVEHEDVLYLIIREIPISQISRKDGNIISEAFNAWKDHIACDKVLKNSTHFMFCERIHEPEYEEFPYKDQPAKLAIEDKKEEKET